MLLFVDNPEINDIARTALLRNLVQQETLQAWCSWQNGEALEPDELRKAERFHEIVSCGYE